MTFWWTTSHASQGQLCFLWLPISHSWMNQGYASALISHWSLAPHVAHCKYICSISTMAFSWVNQMPHLRNLNCQIWKADSQVEKQTSKKKWSPIHSRAERDFCEVFLMNPFPVLTLVKPVCSWSHVFRREWSQIQTQIFLALKLFLSFFFFFNLITLSHLTF